MHGTSVAEATSDASGEVCSEVTAPRRWCAVWTRSRHEALVHQQLEGEPAPIPDVEIEGIRQLVETDLQYDPCPLVREGMMVEVVHGPLTGVVGRLVRNGLACAARVVS